MAIKNKDGTIYKLQGPNPMMNDQVVWQGFQVHNMKFKAETILDSSPVQVKEIPQDDFMQSLKEIKQETKPELPKPEPKQELPKNINKVFCYCLPAIVREKNDGTYGQKYFTIQYNKPFTLEIVIVEEDDLYIRIWSTVKIDSGSILYPRKSSNQGKADAGRWWRTQDSKEKSGGWLITAHPSDYTPSFEGVQ